MLAIARNCSDLWRGNCIQLCMTSSLQKQELVKGLGVAAGECIFALGGPFLFQRFGLNVPEAATAGCLLGAAIGFVTADGLLRFRNRRAGATSVPEITEPGVVAGADDIAFAGMSGNIDSDPTREQIETALARIAARDSGSIRVEVRNGKAVLKGRVRSWIDEAEAERIAFDTPGIQEVDNRLQVVP